MELFQINKDLLTLEYSERKPSHERIKRILEQIQGLYEGRSTDVPLLYIYFFDPLAYLGINEGYFTVPLLFKVNSLPSL
jgi:hypothetical protein